MPPVVRDYFKFRGAGMRPANSWALAVALNPTGAVITTWAAVLPAFLPPHL
jgi:hypothetical protein